MSKRKKTPARAANPAAASQRLKKVLARQKKAELIEIIIKLTRLNPDIQRALESQFCVDVPLKELVAQTRLAIANATDFDGRDVNYNFDYDDRAYSEIADNFARLIKLGHLHEVMDLSLELMQQGSYQVESSDEGLMTGNIEACLEIVFNTLKKADLPANEIVAWCKTIGNKDRVGFICETELKALCEQFN